MRQAAGGRPMSCWGLTPRGRKRVVQSAPHGKISGKGKAMQNNQRVADMVVEVLTRQAETRAQQTGEAFEDAFENVLKTEAGRQLEKLRNGPHRDEGADEWQHDLLRHRAQERRRARQEERSRAQLAAWGSFMQTELRELGLRKDGKLCRVVRQWL